MSFESMLVGYEAWKKSPQGKEYFELEKTYIPVEIKPLPSGWYLEDGGIEKGYFVYANYDEEIDIIVEERWGLPIWSGGYPKFHYIEVCRKYTDEEDEPRQVAEFSVYKLGWKKAWKLANTRAKELMERD